MPRESRVGVLHIEDLHRTSLDQFSEASPVSLTRNGLLPTPIPTIRKTDSTDSWDDRVLIKTIGIE